MLISGETDLSKLKEALHKKNENLSVSASRLIVSGESSVEEALRVIGRNFWLTLSENYGTKVPDINVRQHAAKQENYSDTPGVLLVGSEGSFTEELATAIEQIWMQVYYATSPDEAKACLKANENIAFVILSVDAETADKAADDVAEYRVAMAWSRLPALLLIPDDNEEIKQRLRTEGATSKFIDKDTSVSNIVIEISRALCQNLDYTWGMEEQQ